MATTYKVLAQSIPVGNSVSTLYTVPSATSAVCSTLSVTNQLTSTYYSVAVRPGGASLDPKHFIAYSASLNANDTAFLSVGLSLAATDVISVWSGHGSCSFNLFGMEIT